MPTLRRCAAALLVLLLLAVHATATTLRPKEVDCPVCEKAFTALQIGSTNTFGGVDRDGCTHAAGDQPLAYEVWTCPHCHYSNWAGGFEEGVKPETAERIRAGFTAGEAISFSSQRDLPGWLKYDLLVRVLAMDGADTATLATANLRGAWVARVQCWRDVRAVHEGARLKETWTAVTDCFLAAREQEEALAERRLHWSESEVTIARRVLAASEHSDADPDRVAVERLHAAFVLRNRGENVEILAPLEQLAGEATQDPVVREAAELLLAGIARERTFQNAYATHTESLLTETGMAPESRASQLLALAETYRRLGDAEAAERWYVRTLEEEQLPAWTFRFASEGLAQLDRTALNSETADELYRRCLDRVLERLRDPETARDAYRELRYLQDRSTVRGVVAALDDEDSKVRLNAARTLRFVPDVGADAIGALCRVLREDRGDPRHQAAISLRTIGSPLAIDAFRRGLRARESDVVEECVEALGMLGEREDVPRLIAIAERKESVERETRRALTRLTVREVSSLEEFALWWQEHAETTRAEWVRSAFEQSDVALPAVLDEKAVPMLLATLEDDRHRIRFNALRLLAEITDQRFGWSDLAQWSDSPRARQERRIAILRWRHWWENR